MPASPTAIRLAEGHSLEELYEAIAIVAARNANDMMADMMHDANFIKAEGMPTRQKLITSALAFATETNPLLLLDSPYTDGLAQNEGESDTDFFFRAAMEKIYSPGSAFMRIDYQLASGNEE